jgi:hypothetical protein
MKFFDETKAGLVVDSKLVVLQQPVRLKPIPFFILLGDDDTRMCNPSISSQIVNGSGSFSSISLCARYSVPASATICL